MVEAGSRETEFETLNKKSIKEKNRLEEAKIFRSLMTRFLVMHKYTLYLHIKECEIRHNCRNQNIYSFSVNFEGTFSKVILNKNYE